MHSSTLHAHKSMEQFWHHVDAGHLDASLDVMKSHGFRDETLAVVLNPDSYVTAELQDDTYVCPTNMASDQFPVISIAPGEYKFRKPSFHPLQIKSLGAIGLSQDALLATEARLPEAPTMAPSSGSDGTASIHTYLRPVDGTNLQVMTKPTVQINTENASTAALACPGTIVHEMTHIAQMLEDAIYRPEKRLQRELEAYAVQAELVSSYAIEYSSSTMAAAEVNQFRQRYLGEHEFVPTDFFVQEFMKHDVFARIVRSL